jgi:putative ABC transport system ATP-binding protein
METFIKVRELTKVYSSGAISFRALDGIDLDVNGGEVLMLMGPSGSGKTTLLSIMGCILQATGGSVRIHDREIVGLSERKLPRIRLAHIGFIFQGFNLFPTLAAGENIELSLDLKGIRGRKARARAGELLEKVGLEGKYHTFPADLSGGQKQRVAIARALAGEPDIILADEPTASLDSQSGLTVMEMLHSLARKQGRAVVVVTHDTRTLSYADRIVSIEDGRLADAHIDKLANRLAPELENVWRAGVLG